MAKIELQRGRALRENLLIRNARDKAFLAVVQAVNDAVKEKLGVPPANHSDRRRFLREIGREDLRAAYSDLMKDLHEDCFYTGIINDADIDRAFQKAEEFLRKVGELVS